MYPVQLETKATSESIISASYLHVDLLAIKWRGHVYTPIYDKQDNCHFHTTNFPFQSRNIPSSPVYSVLSPSVYDTPVLAPDMNVL